MTMQTRQPRPRRRRYRKRPDTESAKAYRQAKRAQILFYKALKGDVSSIIRVLEITGVSKRRRK